MARPLKPKLSPEAIAREALAMVDRDGEFTIPALAARLKVSASSLYNHVSGKADIIELMRGATVAGIALPDPALAPAGGNADGGDWTGTVRAIAVEYRRAYAAHPRLIPLFTAYTVRDPATLHMYDVLAQVFAAAGFAPRRTLEAITVLDSFVLGSALDAAAPEQVWAAAPGASTALQDALREGLGGPDRARQAFLYGLDLLLAGFDRESAVIRDAAPEPAG
ncbi:TetR/AcrR family transcriptional regulator C-terminal domain-containing protein [Arthrobacter sp. I2-34]|uniref:TetR/AcrR family transcriptional regulator C-terminal domain-containing protein n=1 Tax=Arthrobacter hankyongi TaxID=2904801 RepID=A0ABS9L2N0_9MICC|nr:TetR/AcrR family transcriptional regulator C-terminal domain-containing protein [Arthrobacter hankyongi]MCG2620952.1 TetR/AcrR family transcriptional regulator C-terminal domain-containing protein [Arthrobacter hankyongi]